MIIITSDHAGYKLKEKLKKYLTKKGINYIDAGPNNFNLEDDYTDYAIKASNLILENKDNKGIFICGSGVGMSITANKIKGIRATVALNKKITQLSVEHNHINVITLGGRNTCFLKAKQIVKTFLTSEEKEGRHTRRVDKIIELENKN